MPVHFIRRMNRYGFNVRLVATSTRFDPHRDPPKVSGDLQDVAGRVHEEIDLLLDPTAWTKALEPVSALFAEAKIGSLVPLLVRRDVSHEPHERAEQAQPASPACRAFERRSSQVDIHRHHLKRSSRGG